jgi:hypothetical protein
MLEVLTKKLFYFLQFDVDHSSMTLEVLMVDRVNPPALLKDSTRHKLGGRQQQFVILDIVFWLG